MKIGSLALHCLIFAIAIAAAANSSVVVNEMELNPPDGGSDWVELYNSGNDTVDISGWSATITDGSWVGRMSVPKGAAIPPDGFYVLNGNPLWNHDNGGFVTLYSESGDAIDKTPDRKDLLNNDFTWGRHPDGHDTNTEGDWGFAYATKGRPNQI